MRRGMDDYLATLNVDNVLVDSVDCNSTSVEMLSSQRPICDDPRFVGTSTMRLAKRNIIRLGEAVITAKYPGDAIDLPIVD